MKTTDFNAKITSDKLNENLNRMFGVNVNFNKYSREQLEDMRNKLRTRVFQQEGTAGINDLLTNETYQKDKAMLDLLNTRIKEMLGEDIKKLKDKMVELSEAKKGVRAPKHKIHAQGTAAKDYDGDGKKESPKDEVWGSRKKAAAKSGKPFEEGKKSKPDFLDMDKDGNKKEPMKKAAKDKKVAEAKKDKAPEGTYSSKRHETDGQRVARLAKEKRQAEKEKAVKEGFPTVAGARAEKEKSTGKFDKKDTSTGTQYTRKTGQLAKGEEDSRRPATSMKSKKTGKPLGEANAAFKHNVRFVNESLAFLINEDEEGKAKAITAASDMVNDFTSWMQRVGQYQTKSMIELADAIRADFGAAEAEAFKQSVGPALSATLETLTQQREAISGAVAVLAGEAAPEDAMGMEPGMDAGIPPEPGMDIASPDEMNPMGGDEFGASDAAAGAGTTGREMRESKQERIARKLAESHSIMAKLAK